MFGRVIVMRLSRDWQVLTQICEQVYGAHGCSAACCQSRTDPPLCSRDHRCGWATALSRRVLDSGAWFGEARCERLAMRAWILAILACFSASAASTLLDQGYAAMYNLDFQSAHGFFGEWKKIHPKDPMGPASDAAAVLFSEFARMHVLESEFFTNDRNFMSRYRRPQADPAAKRKFEQDLV